MPIISLLLICFISAMTNCQTYEGTNILTSVLGCQMPFYLVSMRVSNMYYSNSSQELIKFRIYGEFNLLDADNSSHLPVGFKILEQQSLSTYYEYKDVQSLGDNGLDANAIRINSNKQRQWYDYEVASNVPFAQFKILIIWLDVSELSYINNYDRWLSLNTNGIPQCINSVRFSTKLKLFSYMPHSVLQNQPLFPLNSEDCSHGQIYYRSKQCRCKQSFVSQYCEKQVYELSRLDIKSYKSIQNNQVQYFRLESDNKNKRLLQQSSTNENQMHVYINLQLLINGQSILNSQAKESNKLKILFRKQKKSVSNQQLPLPTIFNQENPNQQDDIYFNSEQEILLIAVYNPKQNNNRGLTYKMQVKAKIDERLKLIIIVVAVSVSIATLLLLTLGFYCLYCRDMSRWADSVPASRRIGFGNRVTNLGVVDGNRYFPEVQYKYLTNNIQKRVKISQDFQKESENSEQVCVICLQDFNQTPKGQAQGQQKMLVRYTYCNHIFHSQCLSAWLKKQLNCPLCREQFTCDKLEEWEQALGLKDTSHQAENKNDQSNKVTKNEEYERYSAIWNWHLKRFSSKKILLGKGSDHENPQQ